MVKNTFIASLFLLVILSFNISAQRATSTEKFGKTLNQGLGIGGYYG
jgi:hypothetical protein